MLRTKLLFLVFTLSHACMSQDAITVKYVGLTVHPFGDPTAQFQPHKWDRNARFVPNYGIFLGYEKFVYEDLISIKVIQGVFADCSNGFAIVSHIGVRGAILNTEKHRVYIGIGPALLMRDSWKRFGEEYTSSGFFKETFSKKFGAIQYRLAPVAIELEYDYAINAKNQISLSFIPGYPFAFVFNIGWKHWLHVKEFDKFKPYIPKTEKVKRL